jgi:hypothetical protein
MIKGSCKYGVRQKGLKHRGKRLWKIVPLQVVVLACLPDVAHQDSKLPDSPLRCTPTVFMPIQILLMN